MPDVSIARATYASLSDIDMRSYRAERAKFTAWQEWIHQRSALQKVLATGLSAIEALMAFDRETYLVDAKDKAVIAFACDTAGGLLDTISNAVGRAKREADEAGLNPDEIAIDVSELEALHAQAEARHGRTA